LEQLPNAYVDGSKKHANCRFYGQMGDMSGGVFEQSKFDTSSLAMPG